ncbi:MAG: NlpC/P60 family protein [Streptosporangiaceae bacterium]
MHRLPSVRTIVRQRAGAITVAVLAAGLIIGVGGSAGAVPMPTISQVQARLTKLQAQISKLDQQYVQVKQELAATNQRLALVNKELARYSSQFASMRQQIARIAVTAYETGNINSSIALLTSGNPQQILNQSAILLELSNSNNAEINQFLKAARQLTTTQLLVKRNEVSILALRNNLKKRLATMNNLASKEQKLLAELQPAQQTGLGAGGSTGGIKYTGPTSTQAEKAVAFAYGAIGCPYVWGGTGPCSAGYDCSGLTMSAWAYAGVSIPRTSYDQEASLPQVNLAPGDPTKYLQPGDILGFIGNAHVGIYVGKGDLIDAPVPGASVELVPLSGWYLSNLDEAVRP